MLRSGQRYHWKKLWWTTEKSAWDCLRHKVSQMNDYGIFYMNISGRKKNAARQVPRLLTIDHNNKGVNLSKDELRIFTSFHNSEWNLDSPLSNWSERKKSKQWVAFRESVTSAWINDGLIFWDSPDIILIDFFAEG